MSGVAPKVAIRPRSSPHNRYVDLFAAAFEAAGWEVEPLHWHILPVLSGRLMIVHWPDEFFHSPDRRSLLRSWLRVLLIVVSRRVFGVRWIWVVHNLAPHDQGLADTRLSRAFTGQLDGLVFLSQQSRAAFVSGDPQRAAIPHLVTRHGDYRTGATTTPSRWRRASRGTRLLFAGQVRPYKNVEALVDAARDLDHGTELGIAGFATPDFAASLGRRAEGIAAVHLDLRREPIDETELERIVDGSDAVILPYRQILNSGMALFALSRNRPVIAPALGGLVELRDEVGADWVYLYDGALTGTVLRAAAKWVRTTDRPLECRLGRHDWNVIGPELVRFAQNAADNSAA